MYIKQICVKFPSWKFAKCWALQLQKLLVQGVHKIHLKYELLIIFPLNMIYEYEREFTQGFNKSAKDSFVVIYYLESNTYCTD